MNRKYTYTVIVILVTVGLYYADQYVDREIEHYPEISVEDSNAFSKEFSEAFYPSATDGEIIKHAYYALSYSEEHEQAEWVAYELKKDQLSKNDMKRPYFVEDRKVKTGSAHWRNYKNSGYDRGHLCPAGDRRFTYDAFHETFLTSNISPQNHEFNSGVWNKLEQKVRYWADKYDGVFVITGGVLEKGLKTIGDENVSVPNEFYKIVVDKSGKKMKVIAFLIKNKNTQKSFYDFVVTVDAIEQRTGIDFFSFLPASKEEEIEQTIDVKAWGKR